MVDHTKSLFIILGKKNPIRDKIFVCKWNFSAATGDVTMTADTACLGSQGMDLYDFGDSLVPAYECIFSYI